MSGAPTYFNITQVEVKSHTAGSTTWVLNRAGFPLAPVPGDIIAVGTRFTHYTVASVDSSVAGQYTVVMS